MKATALQRRTPLRPGTKPLVRHVWIRPFNPERRARLFARNFGEHRSFIVAKPCAVPGCRQRDIEAAHVVPRGMGGCKGTWRDLVPLCGEHHREQEGHTAEFEARYNVDLTALAASYVAEAERQTLEVGSVSPREKERCQFCGGWFLSRNVIDIRNRKSGRVQRACVGCAPEGPR